MAEKLPMPERIAPQARPVDTFVHAGVARPLPTNRLQELGHALRTIEPSIQRHLAIEHHEYTEEEKAAAREDFLKNRKSWKEAAEKGLVDASASPWYRREYDRSSAYAAVQDTSASAWSEYLESDLAGSDDINAVRGFFSSKMASLLEDEESSPWFRDTAASQGSKNVERLLGQHQARRSQAIEADFRVKAQTRLSTVVDEGLAQYTGDGDFKALQENMAVHLDDLYESNFNSEELTRLAVDSVGRAAEELRDPDILDAIDGLKVGGEPLNRTAYARDTRDAVESRIYARTEREARLYQAKRKEVLDQRKNELLSTAADRLIADPTIDITDMQAEAVRTTGDMSAATAIREFQQAQLTAFTRVVNNDEVEAELAYRIYHGEADPEEIMRSAGKTITGSTASKLLREQSQHERYADAFNDAEIRKYRSDLERFIKGDEFSLSNQSILNATLAANRFSRLYRNWVESNPDAGESAKYEEARRIQQVLLKEHSEDDEMLNTIREDDQRRQQEEPEAALPPGTGHVPEQAAQDLINNPALLSEFEEFYGEGVGTSILQQYRSMNER